MSERGNVPTQPDGRRRQTDGRSSRTNLTLDTFVDSVASDGGACGGGAQWQWQELRSRARKTRSYHSRAAGRRLSRDGNGNGMARKKGEHRGPSPSMPPCCAQAGGEGLREAQEMPFCQQGTYYKYEVYSEALNRKHGLEMLHFSHTNFSGSVLEFNFALK